MRWDMADWTYLFFQYVMMVVAFGLGYQAGKKSNEDS